MFQALCIKHKVPIIDGVCPECEVEKVLATKDADRIRHYVLYTATTDTYRCPNSGRVVEASRGDDKVICSCQRPNPFCAYEVKHNIRGLHQVSFLKKATENELWLQRQADLAEKAKRGQS